MDKSEDKLRNFAKKEHKKRVKQAVTEGVVALLPLVALFVGFTLINTRPNSQELLSPQRLGIVSYLFPILIISYFVFLFFVMRDIHRKFNEY